MMKPTMEPTVSPDTTTATSNKRSDSDAHPVDGDSPVQAVTDVGFWWHSIDLNGVLTPGGKSAGVLQMEWQTMQVPDLAGKTVLDIGAWDGYFSFQAEQHGAREVTALDHYVWSIDRKRWGEYHEACKQAGKTPLPVEQTEYWDPKGLPGKRGFDLACRVRNSKVKSIVRDYMEVSPDEIGTFDVVLYLGVLYHMRNPLEALLKVASLTRELAVIETHAVEIYGHDVPLAEFYPESELNGDPSNWWGPNLAGLIGLCKAAGFRRVLVKKGPPKYGKARAFGKSLAAAFGIPWGTRHRHYRAIIHAWK